MSLFNSILLVFSASVLFYGLIDLLQYIYKDRNYVINCNKKKLIEETIFWCMHNMQKDKNRKPPFFRINYYSSKKYAGHYHVGFSLISIYVSKNSTPHFIVSTVIHEFQHYIDLHSRIECENYDRKNIELGYQNNPYEKRARDAESKYTDLCMDYLCERKLLVTSSN
ncbi:MAG: hypothetical protein ACK5D5_10860 [Bacteroidota bacterium]|jgi:hypothetical protein